MGKKNRRKQMPKAPAVTKRKKEKIHIAVPVTDNVMGLAVSVFLSQLDRLSVNPQIPYAFSWHVIHGKKPVHYARNVLVGNFLKNSDASRLWFIDTDMEPPENALDMLKADGDIVAPIMFAFNHASPKATAGLKLCMFKYDLRGDKTFQSIIPEDPSIRYTEMDGAGTAAMIIKREVLEDRRLWLDGKYLSMTGEERDCATHGDDGEFAPPIFQQRSKPNGMIMRGEDLDFCLRARALGYKLTGDLGVHFGHIKQVNLREVAEFVKSVAYRAQAHIGAKANTGESKHEDQVDRQEGPAPTGDGLYRRGEGPPRLAVDSQGHLRRGEGAEEAEGGGGTGTSQDNGRGIASPAEGQGHPVSSRPAA